MVFLETNMTQKKEAIRLKIEPKNWCVAIYIIPVSKKLYFIEKALDQSDQLHPGGYLEIDQYLTLVMINNMAKERSEFEIVMNMYAKLEIWQHCEFLKVVSKTKIASRHCQIALKYSENISNFSDHLTKK